jgi:NTP pyrophosphatase (non-canonical NTP hydrolase)
MSNDGLTKLMEECGELTQVAAKMIAFPNDNHPDGGPPLRQRLEEEIADVCAAVAFVADILKLDANRIMTRGDQKRAMFEEWHKDPNA